MRRPVLVMLAVSVVLLAGASSVVPAGGETLAWSVSFSPNPVGTQFSYLGGVACPTPTSCFAVGFRSTPSGTGTFVKHWSGSGWRLMKSANPIGSAAAVLTAVTCPTPKSCYAVGTSTAAGHVRTLVEHWNGNRWGIMPSPNPSRSLTNVLSGVACPSTRSCFAVGTRFTAGHKKTLVEHWNGSVWGIMLSPNATRSTATSLFGVACPSTKSCFAAGSHAFRSGSRSLVEHWNGSSWGIIRVSNPTGTTNASLLGMSCPSTKSCFAVGNYYPNNSLLVEHWNGTEWGIMTGLKPSGSTAAVLNGISCPSTKSCFAVGNKRSGSVNRTLIEHWSGGSWGLMTSPNPAVAGVAALSAVSCSGTTRCTAVGFFQSPNAKSLLEQYR